MKYKLKTDQTYNPFISTDIRDVIFNNRGITDLISYIAPTKEYLLDPFLLDNVKDGVHLLSHKINKNCNLFIIVDSDVDGFTSASILYNYLMQAHPNLTIDWMVHADKSHGINLDLIPENAGLIICPDSSSNEYDKHKKLALEGIDVLVIDHHEAPEYSEHAVVINNQLSENYPNKNLSGAGMVYKFCQAYDQLKDFNYADNFLDLTAMGIIADLMDVRPLENRYIIDQGLKNINNIFFKALINKQTYSLGAQSLNSIGIAFYIAPLINAVTRVGTLEERQTLFEAFINGEESVKSTKRGAKEGDMENIAEKAVRVATNAKNRQKKIVDELKAKIKIDLDQQDLSNSPLVLVRLDSIPNRNLTGLVANQLASEYKRPVLLLIENDDNKSLGGSGRNYNFHEIDNLKECLQDSQLFEFAEGHQSAFGVKIMEDKINDFMTQIDTIMPTSNVIDEQYVVDFVFKANDFSTDIIREITKLRSLWGKGFDEVMIAVEDIPVNSNNFFVMGKRSEHMKFVYNDITYIKFWVNEEEKAKFVDKEVIVNIVGRCDTNIWNDTFSYQVILQDYIITKEGGAFAF